MSSDPADRLEPELTPMLEAERARDDLDAATRARLFRRLAIAVGGPVATSEGPPPPAPPSAPAMGARLPTRAWTLGAGMFALGGALGFAVHAAIVPAPRAIIRASTSAEPVPPATPLEPASATSAAPSASPTPTAPAPIAPSRVAPAVTAPSPIKSHTSQGAAPLEPAPSEAAMTGASGDSGMEAERILLETARAALVRGDAEGALGAIATHAARFPSGRLTEEREALRVEALVRAGRHAEARARADAFRRLFPNSLLSPVVDAAVKSIP